MKYSFYNVLLVFSAAVFLFGCRNESSPSFPVNQTDSLQYAGKVYHAVKIGKQTWLKENIDAGNMITLEVNSGNNGIIEKYCYANNPTNCARYGGLYQWNEAMQYAALPGAQGICPPGWHIPAKAEFDTLAVLVNNDGNAIKAIDQGEGNGAGTNTSGFSALLAGYRGFRGSGDSFFNNLGFNAGLWSSSEMDSAYAGYLCLTRYYKEIFLTYYSNKNAGYSVRCLKN